MKYSLIFLLSCDQSSPAVTENDDIPYYSTQRIQIMSTYESGGLGWNYPQTSLLPVTYQSDAEEVANAIDLFQDKKDTEVIELLVPYIEKNPDDAVAHSLIGASFFRLKDLKQASYATEHVVMLKPSALAHVNHAITLQFLGQPDQAIEHYGYALEFDKKNFLAQRNMASLMYLLKDLAQSEYYLGEMIRSNPNDSYPFVALGQVLAEQGRYEEAEILYRFRIAELEIVSEEEYRTANGLLLDLPLALGRVCLLQGKYPDAKHWLHYTIEHSKKREGTWTNEQTYAIEAYRTLAGLALDQQDLDLAEEYVNIALEDIQKLLENNGMPGYDGSILKNQLLEVKDEITRRQEVK